MKKRLILKVLGLLLLLPMFSGCNDTDDVAGIFTGKTWKLTYITVKDSHQMFNFWGNDNKAREQSMKLLDETGRYVITFNGMEESNIITGTLSGTVITSTFTGSWSANGKDNQFNASIQGGNESSDILAKNFIEGLNNATSYGGDERNLYLYYKIKDTLMDTEKKQLELDKRYIRMASIWAENSYCQRRKVGALIVKDKMIISDGYNGTPSGFENVCEDENNLTKPYVLHAEANAITKIARSNNSSDGATMYVTASPCIECAKLIIQAGIKRVVYSEHYRLEDGIELLKRAGIEVIYTEMNEDSSPNK